MNKAARRLAVLAVVLLAAPPLSAPAHASTESERQAEIQQEIERLRGQMDEVAADEAEVVADLRVTQRRRAQEQTVLAGLDAQVAAAQETLDVAQAELDEASAAERAAKHELERVRSQLADAQERFKEQAVSAYMHNLKFEPPAELRDPDHLRELGSARVLIDVLNDKQAAVIERFESLKEDAAELEADAASSRLRAASKRNEVRSQTQALEVARGKQAAATAAVTAEANHEQALVDSLRGKRAAYEKKIREFQRESDSIASLLRRRGKGGVRISGRGSLSAPVADPVITSTFGYRTHPIFGDRRLHTGLDFRAPTGTPLYASAPGEVIFAGPRGGYGNCTIIDHGGGIATLYAHQSVIRVEEGDQVRRGQAIGAAGSTGFATGPHLHFEVRVNGTPVDPLPYL